MSTENGVQGVSSEFPGQIEIIQEIIQSSEDAMSHFGLTIEQVLPRLSEVSGPGQIEALVEAIDKTINEQRHGNLDLNSRLLQISRQVEHLKEELAIARRESLTDDLTELPNRKCFDQTIIQMIADAKMSNNSLCVLMIDIDHFKQFNDKYGHQSGDAVLKLVAATMKNSVKGCDHVARYGGEEFIAILPETDLKIAEKVANRIRESVSRQELIHHSTGQSRGYVTLSIGIGMLNVDDSIHSLIKRADACLYEAKNAGRNCVLGETCLSGDNTESGAHAA